MKNLLIANGGGAVGAGIVLPTFWLGVSCLGDNLAQEIITGATLWVVAGSLLALGTILVKLSKAVG